MMGTWRAEAKPIGSSRIPFPLKGVFEAVSPYHLVARLYGISDIRVLHHAFDPMGIRPVDDKNFGRVHDNLFPLSCDCVYDITLQPSDYVRRVRRCVVKPFHGVGADPVTAVASDPFTPDQAGEGMGDAYVGCDH